MGWPILEAVAVAWLNDRLSPTEVSTDLPDNVGQLEHGFVRVARGPGADDGVTDSPLLDVEAFHAERFKAAEIAERARAAAHAMTARLVNGTLIDSVNTTASPHWVYYGPNVERYIASYRVEYRRRSAP